MRTLVLIAIFCCSLGCQKSEKNDRSNTTKTNTLKTVKPNILSKPSASNDLPNTKVSLKILTDKCNDGHTESCFELGIRFAKGDGVKKSWGDS